MRTGLLACLTALTWFPRFRPSLKVWTVPVSLNTPRVGHQVLQQRYSSSMGPSTELQIPRIRRAVLLDKLTRWEVLCEKANSDAEIEKMKKQFPGMFETYRTHIVAVQYIIDVLQERHKVHLDVVKAQRSRPVSLHGIDAIISAGGDGTFLEAASLVGYTPLPCTVEDASTDCIVPPLAQTNAVWVMGINTDPSRSEGRLLLQTPPCTEEKRSQKVEPTILELRNKFRPEKHRSHIAMEGTLSKASLECMNESIDKIVNGTFNPIRRRRIRVTIIDPPPTEQSAQPPGVALRHETLTRRQEETLANHRRGGRSNEATRSTPSFPHDQAEAGPIRLRTASTEYWRELNDLSPAQHTLQYRAVNDVLMTSKESHQSMYVEMVVDDGPPQRSKNSGVIICTGSGSSAWAYNASKVSEEIVAKIVDEFIQQQPLEIRESLLRPSVKSLSLAVNNSLLFDPEVPQMRFVVRDPIDNRVFSTPSASGFCRRISLRPLNAEVQLSLDGLSLIPVKFGQSVIFEIGHQEDALLTGS